MGFHIVSAYRDKKEFDADGRVLRVCNPYRSGETKQWTTNVYDTASRVVEVDLPDSSTVLTTYGVSTSSPIGVTKQITDQAGKKRKGYTDAAGNMVRVIEDPDTLAYTTDYTFDTLGNLRKTSQGSQYRYFMHDSLGRLNYAKQVEQTANSNFSGSSYADPITSNNQWSVKYLYDDNGNITSTTDARNKTVNASYDHLNRLYLRDYADTSMPDVSFYYDGKGLTSVPNYSKGKTTKVTSSVSENRYLTFDIFGHVLTARQTTDSNNYDTSYTYDLSGRLTQQFYPSGSGVETTFNGNGEISNVYYLRSGRNGYTQISRASNFVYNSAGGIKSLQLGNSKYETYEYNNRQQLTQIGLGTSTSDQSLLKINYTYDTSGNHDNNGNLLKQEITVPGLTPHFIQTYTYDALNRLESATEMYNSSQNWKQEFSYDRYGNRNYVTGTGHTTTLGSCATSVCNPSFDTATNRFATGQTWAYDANGNVSTDAGGNQYTLDQENKQTEIKNSGNTTIATYAYDGEGKRVKKTVGSTTTIFVYDAGGSLIEEYSGSTVQLKYTYAGGRLLATESPTSSSGEIYLTADHLGSPRLNTNNSGSVVARHDYFAFGEEITDTTRTGAGYSSDSVRKKFTGYERDAEAGLDFAEARYFSPSNGRFTAVDPLMASATIKNPQTFNRYTYVTNSPYKFVDPLGLLAQFSTGACGGDCPNSYRSSGPTDFDDVGQIREFSTFNLQGDAAETPATQSTSARITRKPDQTYDVTGADATDAMNRADARTANSNCDGGYAGCTYVEMTNWVGHPGTGQPKKVKGGYEVTEKPFSPTVDVTITVYLPNWTGYATAKKSEREAWDRKLGLLKDHEEGHVDIAIQEGNRNAAALAQSLPRSRTFTTRSQNITAVVAKRYAPANGVVARGYASFRARDKEYDRLTQHGLIPRNTVQY